MNIPDEAAEAAAERYPECARPVNVSPLSRIIGEFVDSSEHILCKWDDDFGEFIPVLDASKTILTAALPAIEKEIRAQVAAELRGELPVQLAETAQSPSGWLADAEELHPKADPSHEYVWLMSYDDSHSLGSIDLYHIAEHAASIAEGESK